MTTRSALPDNQQAGSMQDTVKETLVGASALSQGRDLCLHSGYHSCKRMTEALVGQLLLFEGLLLYHARLCVSRHEEQVCSGLGHAHTFSCVCRSARMLRTCTPAGSRSWPCRAPCRTLTS